jgi:hypothetical protein
VRRNSLTAKPLSKEPQVHHNNVFDQEVFLNAYTKLKVYDLRVKHIVLRLQHNWRRRQENRVKRNSLRLARFTSSGLNMRSHMVHAPCYFGESCLWVPLEQWKEDVTPKHIYNARCDKRAELVCIPRSAIESVLFRFSPWLPERFEYFRESVVEQLKKAVSREPDEIPEDPDANVIRKVQAEVGFVDPVGSYSRAFLGPCGRKTYGDPEARSVELRPSTNSEGLHPTIVDSHMLTAPDTPNIKSVLKSVSFQEDVDVSSKDIPGQPDDQQNLK